MNVRERLDVMQRQTEAYGLKPWTDDMHALIAFARAVLDAAEAAEAPIRGPLPPSRVVPTRVLYSLADEHLGDDS